MIANWKAQGYDASKVNCGCEDLKRRVTVKGEVERKSYPFDAAQAPDPPKP
jgi:hypothetical protein